MNIEGAERLAVGGMLQTIQRTRNVAIACHEFTQEAARPATHDEMRMLEPVREFLEHSGFVLIRPVDDPLPWVRDTQFGFNPAWTKR